MSPPAGVVDGLLADRYRLGARLGAGGNGEVWRARDERLDRDVAVKVLRPELADDQDVRARFRAEARHAGGLRHPGIAAVFDYAEADEGAWLVLELVDGQPLSEVLRREVRLPVDRTLDLVEQAASALQAAHEAGVVHRDVKPGNLLLRSDGRLVVTDFGIAHAAGAVSLTRTGQVVGTAAYLSPEQASGRPVSAATDLYALGVVAHECLSGARPFERDDPVAVLLAHLHSAPPPLPPDVPSGVGDLVHRLMAKDPADRPASARDVQQEAAALRLGPAAPPPATAVLPTAQVQQTPPQDRPGALTGRSGQRRAVRATAVALGLLALALGVRDAVGDDPAPPAGVQQEGPAGSAPPAPAVTSAPSPIPQDRAPQDGQDVEESPAQRPGDDERGGDESPVEQPAERQGAKDAKDAEERQEEEAERQREQGEQQQERQEEQDEQRQERQREQQGRGGGG